MPDTAFCNLCESPKRVPLDELFQHLREVHDFHEEPATWPDGEWVIVDETLEPTDFTP
jgi:hypothetical protein